MPTRLVRLALLVPSLVFAAPPAAKAAATAEPDGLDKSVAPGDDFNAYASGGWLKKTEIPADESGYGVWWIVYDEAQRRTAALIQEVADAGTTPGAKKIGDYYATYMDEAAIEARGTAALKPQLAAVAAIADKTALARALGAALRSDEDPLNAGNFHTENLLGVWIAQSLFDPSRNVPYLLQGGLGMPDRDYYLSEKPQMVELRATYLAHVAAVMRLAGFADAEPRAAKIVALEKKLAAAHATLTNSEDVHQAAEWKRDELPTRAPGLAWGPFLEAAGLKSPATFILWQPGPIAALSTLVASEPLDAWKDWLAFHTVQRHTPFLPKAFVDEEFAFYGKALTGTPALRPRWKRGIEHTSDALGEAIGKLYVERYFPPESKAKVQAIVDDLLKAFAKRIDALAWMTPATRAKAKEKLASLKVGVGYPDRWRDYSGLSIVRGDAFGNAERAELFEYSYQLAKLGQPVDRDEWWISSQTVNALNLPLQNALNFPGAILQPPFFDPRADAAANYGSIGAIIGHEVSHSFDNTGSQFDAQGKLADWWTKVDFEHFKASSEALAAQFDAYKPFPDLAVNGHQTLGEDIADVAGLAAAYDAWKLSLGGKPAPVHGGFTGDQLFFISFAQTWRVKMRDSALRESIATDAHAPQQYRLLAVRNLDAWYAAFSVKPKQKLYLAPKDRVRVW